MHALVIDDDPLVRVQLSKILTQAGFSVMSAKDGSTGVNLARGSEPNIIICDLNLPDRDGFSVVRQLRSLGSKTPILILSGRDAVEDKVAGLDLGGDDYITKPFKNEEFLARVRALLRRGGEQTAEPEKKILSYRGLEMDREKAMAWKDGHPLHLRPLEWTLLEYFLANPERVLSRRAILETVWGIGFEPGTNMVAVLVHRLRMKLEDPPEGGLIRTIPSVGYILGTAEGDRIKD